MNRLVSVSLENCWDCENRRTSEELDEYCIEHSLLIYLHYGFFKNVSTDFDCSCKEPIECEHQFEEANKDSPYSFFFCKKCGVNIRRKIALKLNLVRKHH